MAPSTKRRASKKRPARRAARPVIDPIITMNAGGIIQSASESVEPVFGWTATELLGRNVKVLIPEPRRSALDRYLDRYRHSDSGVSLTRTRRFAAVRKDGTPLQIELSMSRASLPQHVAPFFIGIIRDVSREIDVRGSDVEERTRLQQLVTEQTRALATANLRLHLADRLAALGTLAAGLGHDMNNVLLPVRARLNAMEHAGVPSSALHHLAAVRASIAYLQHLSDALHFLAVDPDGTSPEADGEGSTDLAEWWQQVGSLLRKAIPKHVKLRVALPKGLPMAAIAPHWLTQAMLNLIVNAGESIPATRRNGAVRIWSTLESDGKTIRIAVTDNGRGMSASTQRRAFDLFFTTKSRSMGTGLGLPLARKVAARAGGGVEIQSDQTKGTTVTLALPVALFHPMAIGRERRRLRASISVGNPRAAALLTQVLVGAGVEIGAQRGAAPGETDLWFTDPTAKAATAAKRWRLKHPEGTIVTVGPRAAGTVAAWRALHAASISAVHEIDAVRTAVREAVSQRERHTPTRS